MRKFGRIRFDDPEDLRKWSNGFFSLFLQLGVVDVARRRYKRSEDKKLQRRSEELKKLLHKINDMLTQANHTLIPDDEMGKCIDVIEAAIMRRGNQVFITPNNYN